MKIIIPTVILFAAYAFIENRFVLCVRHEKFRSGGIRIAHIADLHKRSFGKENKRLCDRVYTEKPDIILISGDLVSRDCTDFSTAEATLKQLCTIAPVYTVFGNHETDLSPEYKEKFVRTVKRSGAVLLKNETIRTKIRGRNLNISGMELKYSVYKKNGGYRSLDSLDIAEIYDVLGEKPVGETVLLVHNPLFAPVYAQWGADYTVSGHVHGGAVRLPFTGIGLLSPERRFFPRYTKGVYTIGNMKLLLSSGLGKPRLFNPPEIVIYEL